MGTQDGRNGPQQRATPRSRLLTRRAAALHPARPY